MSQTTKLALSLLLTALILGVVGDLAAASHAVGH